MLHERRLAALDDMWGNWVDHGPFVPIHDRIQMWALRAPERPAVTYGSSTLTYADVDQLVKGLATQLAAAGVRRGDMVALFVANSLELPVSMLATLRLGAAFVPCDPAWPAERARTALNVLRPRVVLTRGGTIPGGWPVLTVHVDRLPRTSNGPELTVTPEDVAYGVFTSGTTGIPKCATNLHRGLANRFDFMTRYYEPSDDEVALVNSRHTFDPTIWQLLWPLTIGGRTIIPDTGEFLDLDKIIQLIDRHRVSVTDFLTAVLALFLDTLTTVPGSIERVRCLRRVLVGGEEVVPALARRFRELLPDTALYNTYGPSETTIGMTYHRIVESQPDEIPLGRPIDNCFVVVADDRLDPVPPGHVGEILIGGACVGAGYVGEPELTARAFVETPYSRQFGSTLYRTGDLGWFGADGLLRFRGRRDRQVKINGVRIELGEIEATAASCPGVRQVKAFVVEGSPHGTALAIAVGGDVEPNRLQEHLSAHLPRTSLPQHRLVLSALPLTDNGKVDVPALRAAVTTVPADDGRGERQPAQPFSSALPSRICRVLGAALGDGAYGPDDDFFRRGGNSLQAISGVLRLREELGLTVSVADFYEHPTPARLARLAETATGRPRDRESKDEEAAVRRDSVRLVSVLARSAPVTRSPARAAAEPGIRRRVVVTGGTGFVGARVVHDLLERTDYDVVCLVRGEDDERAAHRMSAALTALDLALGVRARRPTVYAADLSSRLLGLPRDRWHELAESGDLVLHIGAMVNLLFDYATHRPANVLGTLEVTRLALHGSPTTLHHVSTLGVLGHRERASHQGLAESWDLDTVPLPAGGYTRSKWMAERIVASARACGLPVTIYRLGEVMPAADDGVPNDRAVTHLLLLTCHRMGVRPDVALWTDYTPVDAVAARVLAGLADPWAEGKVFNVFHRDRVDLGVLMSHLPAVPVPQFLDRLRSAPFPEAGVLLALWPAGGTPFADNAGPYAREMSDALERRHRLRDGDLEQALDRYRARLATARTASA